MEWKWLLMKEFLDLHYDFLYTLHFISKLCKFLFATTAKILQNKSQHIKIND